MPTVFESISDGFYTAFFEPDPDKRKAKNEKGIKKNNPVIKSAVENGLRDYLQKLLEKTWKEKGWKYRVEKFYGEYQAPIRKSDPLLVRLIDDYKVSLDITLRKRASRDKDVIVDTLTPEVRTKTNDAIEAAKTVVAKLEPPSPVAIREINLHENHRIEEAIPLVEGFLKECYRDNVRRVRIIHGKGIGVLREAVREFLGTHKFVIITSISSADNDHGGEGATEANLIAFSAELLD